jgi:hypothetical protein
MTKEEMGLESGERERRGRVEREGEVQRCDRHFHVRNATAQSPS